MKNNTKTRLLIIAKNGLIAALYTVLSIIIAPLAFGTVQVRFSEALTLLPVIAPHSVIGVTLGCALTNLIGASTGANFLGIADVFIGSLATLFAALLTVKLGKKRFKGLPLIASLPPVLINAAVIGLEWCYVTTGGFSVSAFLLYAATIGLGQLVSCTFFGTFLVSILEKTKADKYIK